MKKIKIYISLPITGKEDSVMERYLIAKDKLEFVFEAADTKDYELEVVPPLDIDKIGTPEQDTTKPLGYWLGEDIKLMMDCDAVFFCEGVGESRGCQLECRCVQLYQKVSLNQLLSISENILILEELISELDKQV